MSFRHLALVIALALAVACTRSDPPSSAAWSDVAPPPARCDDGGDGGVMIDGVCL